MYKTFKKSDLMLKEDVYTNVSNDARRNPSGEANVPLGDLTSSSNDGQTKIVVNPNDPNTRNNLTRMANALGPEETKKTDVEFSTGKQANENLDVDGTIMESVSFTKGELTSWLKTL